MDRLVQMYVEHEEELERYCLEDPETMLRGQMDILTRRIDNLGAAKNPKGRRREENKLVFLGGVYLNLVEHQQLLKQPH